MPRHARLIWLPQARPNGREHPIDMPPKDTKTVQIRPAQPSDVEALVAMRLRINEHMIARNADTWRMSEQQKRAQQAVYLTDLANEEKRILVAAEGDGTLVGMSVGSIRRHEEMAPSVSGRVDDVWVAPEFRQSGIARALLSGLVAFFKDNGVDDLVLNYAAGNTEAEATWAKLGFRPIVTIASAKVADVEGKLGS